MLPEQLIKELEGPSKEMPNWEVTVLDADSRHGDTLKVERVEITPRGVQIIAGKDTTTYRS